MALNRVTYPTSPTPVSGDWELIVELMLANFLENQNARKVDWTNSNIYKGAVFNIQGVIYLADSDTAISGTASNYIMIVPDGETASAEFVTDLTDAAWDSVYNGYFDASGNFYEFYEGTAETDGEITEARKAFHEKGSDINLEGAALDTEGGDITLEGGGLDTEGGDITNGAGHLIPCTSPTVTTITLSESYYYLPAGIYCLELTAYYEDSTTTIAYLQKEINGTWEQILYVESNTASTSESIRSGFTVFSSGSNVRALISGISGTLTYTKS